MSGHIETQGSLPLASAGGEGGRSFFTVPNVLFAVVLAVLLGPGAGDAVPYRLIVLAVIVEGVYLVRRFIAPSAASSVSAGDVASVVLAVILGWHLATARFALLDRMLFPAPEAVLALFLSEIPVLLKGLGSSLVILASGYLLALGTAIPLGLVVGWRKRLYRAANPFTKVLGPIPPIVYIPYAIALLPTFRLASIFVIFVGAFWPLFINTLHGVSNIQRGLIDSARVLGLRESTLLWRVILPGAMPSICTGATLALVFSFILLTAAELIGATSGIGWYVKNFSDFADYPRVIVGILFISLVVTVITWGMERLERRLLRWRN